MKELQTLQQEIISKVAEYSALKYADNRLRPGVDVIPPSISPDKTFFIKAIEFNSSIFKLPW